ncbi:MAG: hypothetical protein EDM74_06960 [Armatimonadetes bacterium]|nr:MAG: hypothetical protein EDM74_06960 [Armatimonadota bacterium]
MFGVISYVGICMVASGVLSALYVITRPIHIRDEMRSWRLWAGLSVVLMILPYAAFEVQTHTVGKEMADAAEEVIAHSDIAQHLGRDRPTRRPREARPGRRRMGCREFTPGVFGQSERRRDRVPPVLVAASSILLFRYVR